MKNPNGLVTISNKEWGSKARKDEDHYRGFRHRGRTESIMDQLDGLSDEDYAHVPAVAPWGPESADYGDEYADWQAP